MPRLKPSEATQPVRLALTVTAAAASVRRWASAEDRPQEDSETEIQIEGQSIGHPLRQPRGTLLSISIEKGHTKAVGFASGGKTPWMVICELPRFQFEDLLMIILSDKLKMVDMVFDHLRYNKGTLISVDFKTRSSQNKSEL